MLTKSLYIQFFGIAIMFLVFGVVLVRSKSPILAIFFATIVAWVMLPFGLVDIATASVVTTITALGFFYFIFKGRKQ